MDKLFFLKTFIAFIFLICCVVFTNTTYYKKLNSYEVCVIVNKVYYDSLDQNKVKVILDTNLGTFNSTILGSDSLYYTYEGDTVTLTVYGKVYNREFLNLYKK